MAKKIEKLEDLTTDNRNANGGSARGYGVVEESLSRYGAGRSICADKNGKIIAGNTTLQAFASIGGERVLVVETTGDELVVVQRVDLDLDEGNKARELAHADNRTNQIGYVPRFEMIDADITERGCDLGWLWREDELVELKKKSEDAEDQISTDNFESTSFDRLNFDFNDRDAPITVYPRSSAERSKIENWLRKNYFRFK